MQIVKTVRAIEPVPEVCLPNGNKCASPLSELETIFGNIIEVALAFGGIVLFLLLLISGFRFITAGGDPKKLEGARSTLTYAIVGIVAIAVSYLILRFIQYFTGAPVTEFKIFQPN